MKPFDERFREDRRLLLLRLLAESSTLRSNSSIMHTSLYAMGLTASRDEVRADLSWLAEMGLVRLEDAMAHIDVVSLTPRGHDVARGSTYVPGVSRVERDIR